MILILIGAAVAAADQPTRVVAHVGATGLESAVGDLGKVAEPLLLSGGKGARNACEGHEG